jgi:hypothetical protein
LSELRDTVCRSQTGASVRRQNSQFFELQVGSRLVVA